MFHEKIFFWEKQDDFQGINILNICNKGIYQGYLNKQKIFQEIPLKLFCITIVWCILIFGLFSCSSFRPDSLHTGLIPTEQLPTVIAMTVEEMVSKATEEDEGPVQKTAKPSPTFTREVAPTFTPTPLIEGFRIVTATNQPLMTVTPISSTRIPYADIQFLSPGDLSKVTSPIQLHAFLLPGDSGRATIELFGEDGRLMYRKLFVFSSPPGEQANLRTEIDFEIEGVAETATLVVRTDDSYGRMKSAASCTIILLAMGDSDINPAGDHLAPIVIQEPVAKVLVQGGKLMVSGLIRTNSDQPLLVELVTTEGKVIGSRLAGIVPGRAGDYRLFATELTFSVDAPTWVRVTVTERKNGNSTPLQLTSLEVLLSP